MRGNKTEKELTIKVSSFFSFNSTPPYNLFFHIFRMSPFSFLYIFIVPTLLLSINHNTANNTLINTD